MGNQIEYSRLIIKRSTIPGVEPTIPTGDTIDNNFLPTDILVGELFANVEDQKVWLRHNTGIALISTGTTSSSIFTGGTVSGPTIFLSGATGVFSGDGSGLTGITGSGGYSVFTSGSTGNYSIKAINDSTTDALGDYCYAEGYNTTSSGFYAHAEGSSTFASNSSHAEGQATTASGDASHAEGGMTTALGLYSHSEGENTTAIGANSHAGGILTVASGNTSFTHGSYSQANGDTTIVLGSNITGDTANTVYINNLNIKDITDGTSIARLAIDSSGNVIKTSNADYLPLSGGTMFDNAIIQFDNLSELKEGNFDFGGQGGISQICSVGYENNWQSGINHIFDNNGFIRESSHCFTTIPDNTFDSSLRFKVDSRWILDNGDIYVCSDASVGAAVWNLQSSFTGYTYITEDTIAETLVFSGANSIVTTVTGEFNTHTLRVDGDEMRLTALGEDGQTNYLTINRDVIANYASLEAEYNNYAYETLSPTQKNINIYDDTNAQSTYTLTQTSEISRIEDGSGGLSESNINASTAYLLNTGGEGVDTSVSVDQNYAEMKQVEGSSETILQVSNDGFYQSQYGSTGISKGVSKTNFTSLETTGDTATTVVWPLSALEVGTTAVGIKATVTGINSTDDKAYLSELYAAVRMNAYAVTIFGGVDKLEKSEYTTATSTIDIDSLNAAIIVTGEVGETIRWSVKYELIYSV
jgi:hypothetical protein